MTLLSVDEADHKARAWVNGVIKDPRQGWIPHTAHWHSRFKGHPWVQQAEAEGWGRELRSAVTMATKLRLLRGEGIDDVDQLMPSLVWVEEQRKTAVRFAEAAASRARLIDEYGSLDKAVAVIHRQNPIASKTSTFKRANPDVPQPRAYKEDLT